MTEATETSAPKLSDVQKQRTFVQNARKVQTKFRKRGIRTNLETLQKTFFQLLYELRNALTFMQNKHAEHEELLAILSKQALGQEVNEEDLACLQELANRAEPPKESDAGPGATPDQGG